MLPPQHTLGAAEVCVAWLQLVAAEERCALAETEIRQEVSAEMASLLHDMEANYKVGHHNHSVLSNQAEHKHEAMLPLH